MPDTNGQFTLSIREKELRDRLFAPEFTFDEGLALYNSVVADGRNFPVAWEARILELGVVTHPDRQDMRERLDHLRNTAAQGRLVVESKKRLATAQTLPTEGLPVHGKRWDAYARTMSAAIDGLATPVDVLRFAQTRIGFEHRGDARHEGKFTALYERELVASFPQYADRLDAFADIEDSAADTTYVHNGRLISNVMFYQARVVLSCLANLPTAPKTVLEVGGGYGAPARLWMNNPISPPRNYLILDMPESLFFADVFLRKEFGDEAVYYVASDAPLPVTVLERHRFILCPLPCSHALQDLPIDLVINTGSLQEMSEQWVDFYADWFDRQQCEWFYSLNYFAQPVNALWESSNLLSPRLSPRWKAHLLRWNPAFVRMQTSRNYLEALYRKCGTPEHDPHALSIADALMHRAPCGEVLAELMDLVRCEPSPSLMLKVLDYAMRMAALPKEALWLAEKLRSEAIREKDRATVERWHRRLSDERARGVEAHY